MLDRRKLRNEFAEIKAKLAKRGEDLSELNHFGELDERRRQLITQVEQLKAERNERSKQISQLKREKQDATELIENMQTVSKHIKNLDTELSEIDERLDSIMFGIPNIPHESVPFGEDEDDNEEVRKWGNIQEFPFEVQPHWDIGANLNILDFERG